MRMNAATRIGDTLFQVDVAVGSVDSAMPKPTQAKSHSNANISSAWG